MDDGMKDAVERVVAAVRDPGAHPPYHYEVMERHRSEWRSLWVAIDGLLAAYDESV